MWTRESNTFSVDNVLGYSHRFTNTGKDCYSKYSMTISCKNFFIFVKFLDTTRRREDIGETRRCPGWTRRVDKEHEWEGVRRGRWWRRRSEKGLITKGDEP